MKELLVGSVYFGGDVNDNDAWFTLQHAFLKSTTTSYDHVIVLQNQSRKNIPQSMKVVHVNRNRHKNGRQSHAENLAVLLEYFREHKDEYKSFLILDSDCFPVKKGWLGKIRKLSKGKDIAAAVRLENLSLFPHPCAMYIKKSSLTSGWLNFRVAGRPNIYGTRSGHDTGCAIPMRRCFPLVRTNVVNLHPLLSAIYGNMFYHHGTGSRLSLNMSTHGYYRSLGAPMPTPMFLLNNLKEDPASFIERLMARKLGFKLEIPIL
jgi:hypothetical protein